MPQNPMKMMALLQRFSIFNKQHPKIMPFFKAAGADMNVGTVVEMTVKTPAGKEYSANIKITEDDLETVRQLKEMQ